MENLNPLGLPVELVFTTGGLLQELELHNPTEGVVIFKIKSTDREMLELRHFEGTISPNTNRSISIALKQLQPARQKNIKLLVQWVEAPNDAAFKDRRIESFTKEEIKSKQIIIVQKESEMQVHHSAPVQRIQVPPVVVTASLQPLPALSQQPLPIPISKFEEPQNDESMEIQRQVKQERLRNEMLLEKSEKLTNEYKQVAAAREKEVAQANGNGPAVLLILLVVFLGVYYLAKQLTDL